MTSYLSDSADAEHRARMLARSPVDVNNIELQRGYRWTLLQAIAWIATEAEPFVASALIWAETRNALPASNAARAASLEMARWLRHLSAPALSFGEAQVHLLQMINSGSVLIYVDHKECMPIGARFAEVTYNANFTGLAPALDDRYWGYVVVEAESLRQAWEARKAALAPVNVPATAQADPISAADTSVSPSTLFTRTSPWSDLEKWYRARIDAAPVEGHTRKEDEAAAQAVGISRARVRDLRSSYRPESWGKSGRKLGRKSN